LLHSPQLNALLLAFRGLFEGDNQVVDEIAAASRTSPEAAATEERAENVAEAKAKVSEDRLEVDSSKDVLGGVASVKSGVAEQVILLALLRVGEDSVGFRYLLELLFSVGGFVAVRVVLQRQVAIGIFDLRVGG
jgi:hypothetical protein